MSSFQFLISKLWAGRDFVIATHVLPFSLHFTSQGCQVVEILMLEISWVAGGRAKGTSSLTLQQKERHLSLRCRHPMWLVLCTWVMLCLWHSRCKFYHDWRVVYTIKVILLWLLLTTKINHNYGFLRFTLYFANPCGFGWWWGWSSKFQFIIGLGLGLKQDIQVIIILVSLGWSTTIIYLFDGYRRISWHDFGEWGVGLPCGCLALITQELLLR